jgi:hypothetical protein
MKRCRFVFDQIVYTTATPGTAPSSASSRHASQQKVARSVIIGFPQCAQRAALGLGAVSVGFAADGDCVIIITARSAF